MPLNHEKIAKGKMNEKTLYLTAELNALDFLTKAHHFICQTESEDIAWKWVVLTLNGALYGFAICALSQGNPDNIILKTKPGKEKLINFDESLKRCQDPNWMRTTTRGKTLQLSQQQEQSIRILKTRLRNNFEHYIPGGWLIEIHGMPQIAIDVLNVIHFLALDSGNCYRLKNEQRKLIRNIVSESKQVLMKSSLYKETQQA